MLQLLSIKNNKNINLYVNLHNILVKSLYSFAMRHRCFTQIKLLRWNHFSSMVIAISTFVGSANYAFAQIVPDRTLGAEGSRLTTNVQIRGALADSISGGAQRGSNLFHSFSQFNINNGQRVYFVNPAGIQNAIVRITGKEGSNILGTLGVDGNANLFLLNPNGIIFGKNARLDVLGSFVGTTASAFKFGDQGIFSATDPQAPTLLTIQPSALLFNQIEPGAIAVQSGSQSNGGLAVPQGKNLLLVGGNILLDGGKVFAGRIELGGLAQSGAVDLTSNTDVWQLNFPEGLLRADVVLQNNAAAQTTGGGAVAVYARNLNLTGNSTLASQLLAGQESAGTPEDVLVNATGNVSLDSNSSINNVGVANSLGNTGNIKIDAQSIRLTNGGLINTNSQRNIGSIRLNAAADITLDGSSIYTFGYPNSIANSGDITVTAQTIKLSNKSGIISGNLGQGQSGQTTLQAQDAISLSGGSSILSNSSSRNINQKSGDIEIKARSLSLTGDASGGPYTGISADNFGKAPSGNIRITTDGSISLNNASITSSTTGQGDGGNIQIQTQSLSLKNLAQLNTSNTGQGNAGDIFVKAQDTISLASGSFIASNIGSLQKQPAQGKVGNIQLEARAVSFTDGAQLQADFFSGAKGNPGVISINAQDTVSFTGTSTGILANVNFGAVGNGSDISINTRSLSLKDGAILTTSNSGQGNAGNISVKAQDTISLASSLIISNIGRPQKQPAQGKVGNIQLEARAVSLTDGAQLQAGLFSGTQGNSGIVSIKAQDTVSFTGANSGIFTNVESNAVGNGSDIQISAGSVSLTNGGVIQASNAGQGNGGGINISAGSLSLEQSRILSQESESGVGNAGSIDITGRSFSLQNRSLLSTSNIGNGAAGNINITTAENSLVGNNAFIRADTQGGQGNIAIRSGDLILFRNGNITTNATGNNVIGGNINIDTGVFATVGNSNISANSIDSRGGRVRINTQGVFRSADSQISATGASPDLNGIVQINTPGIDPSRGLLTLPTVVEDTSKLIAAKCAAFDGQGNSFIITGRGGLPPNPYEPLSGDVIWTDSRQLETMRPHQSQISTAKPPSQPKAMEFIPATGWVFHSNGEVTLVSSANNSRFASPNTIATKCR